MNCLENSFPGKMMQKADIKNNFHAPGKLLITGEYLVLHGAKALSLPVKFGQSLKLTQLSGIPALYWKTFIKGKLWFEATFSIPDLVIGNTNDFPIAYNLRDLFMNARIFNPLFLKEANTIQVVTELNYDIDWGLGSSSSLTVNIANWAGIDPFDLHFKTYAGSGFDVGTAMKSKPILYWLDDNKAHSTVIEFNPSFKQNIWFAYLGRKKNTSEAIDSFEKTRKRDLQEEIDKITQITEKICSSESQDDFIAHLKEHDGVISELTGISSLADRKFSTFRGYAKYLGAWGGDFAMLLSEKGGDYIRSYLLKKDIKTYFNYQDIILS
jgi:mevalonate kinase